MRTYIISGMLLLILTSCQFPKTALELSDNFNHNAIQLKSLVTKYKLKGFLNGSLVYKFSEQNSFILAPINYRETPESIDDTKSIIILRLISDNKPYYALFLNGKSLRYIGNFNNKYFDKILNNEVHQCIDETVLLHDLIIKYQSIVICDVFGIQKVIKLNSAEINNDLLAQEIYNYSLILDIVLYNKLILEFNKKK